MNVKIPTQLRQLTDGHDQVAATGTTVAEIITDLDQRYPGMAERLLDDGGNLRRFLNVYVNDEDIRFLDGLATPVEEQSSLSIIPAVAGG